MIKSEMLVKCVLNVSKISGMLSMVVLFTSSVNGRVRGGFGCARELIVFHICFVETFSLTELL